MNRGLILKNCRIMSEVTENISSFFLFRFMKVVVTSILVFSDFL